MRLGLAQMNIAFEQPEKNLEKAINWIKEAAETNCDCLCFPEMSFTGFSMHPEEMAAYSPMIHEEMKQQSIKHQIALGYGWISKDKHKPGENHYRLIDQNGMIILDYVKIHPFSAGQEQKFYVPGNTLSYGLLSGISTCAVICYDLRFPELFRIAARHASLILVPANWLSKRHEHWKVLLQARAIENQVYIAGINCTGTQGSLQFLGGSCFINPEGEFSLCCGAEETLASITIDGDVTTYREDFPSFRDAKFSLYSQFYQSETEN